MYSVYKDSVRTSQRTFFLPLEGPVGTAVIEAKESNTAHTAYIVCVCGRGGLVVLVLHVALPIGVRC